MPLYQYQAINPGGENVKGNIEATSLQAAKSVLSKQQLTVFDISEFKAKKNNNQLKLSSQQQVIFTRQLATLLSAGFTLEKALNSIAKQSQTPRLKTLASELYQKVVEGVPFSKALQSYPKVFNEIFCATVAAGEASGHMDTILTRLADHSENADAIKSSVRQAMIYPFILFIVASLMIVYLISSVIPDVVEVFINSGQALPTLTQMLLSLSAVVADYGLWILIGIFIGSIILRKLVFSSAAFKQARFRLALKTPFLGETVKTYHAASYTATLAVLLKSGVKLVQALSISAETIINKEIKTVAQAAAKEVEKGKPLYLSLMNEKHVFPAMLIEFVASGEQSATLPEMLEKASVIFQKQSQNKIRTLTNMLAPLMILVMGGLIFVIVLAILLPIFDLNQTIQT